MGDFRLDSGEAPVTRLDSPRLQSLLAYLLLHRDAPQSRQHLAFLLYPDSTEPQARTNLRKYVHLLRHALPGSDNFISADGQTLQWRSDAPFTLDVDEFERAAEQASSTSSLRDAVNLYHGELLPGCYDDWVLPERERLQQKFIETLERLILLLENQRDYDDAIRYAERLLRKDALREESYRRLMRLHALNDDRAAALRVYHTCATMLRNEFGAEPSTATRDLYERLLNVERPMVATTAGATSPLIGRAAEWTRLLAGWRSAVDGKPQLTLVSGEAGIGKTRLAEEFLMWATRQGIATATAHCYAAEGNLAYAPTIAWLRAHPLPSLDAIWLRELARLMPDLLIEHPELVPPGPVTAVWQRQHLFEALARAILASNKPLVLLIEDLQWCDRDTVEWLHYLLRFNPEARLMIVGTLRTEEVEAEHPLLHLIGSLRSSGELTEIALGPLSQSETGTLAAHLAATQLSANALTRIYQETEGNPLFVVETVRALASGTDLTREAQTAASLPPRVQAVIAARLGQLSPSARQLANLAAVIGRQFTFAMLRPAIGGDEAALVRDLDELWRRRIVRESGADAYDFTHDKLREVAYVNLSSARRRVLHRRVAGALESLHAANLDPISGQLASHYEHAGLNEQAISAYRRAAEAGGRVYANANAIDYLRHALRLLDDVEAEIPAEQRRRGTAEIATQLGDVLHLVGRYDEARTTYQEALNCVNHMDAIARAHLKRKIGNCWRELHRYAEALNAYDAAEMALEEQQPSFNSVHWQTWCEVQLERINVYYWLADMQEIPETVERLKPVIEQQGTPQQRARFYQTLCLATLRIGRYVASDEAVAYQRAFLAALIESSDLLWLPSARFQLGFVLLWHGDLDEAEHEMLVALTLAEQRGDVSLQGRCLTYLAVMYRRRNEPEKVRTYAERGLHLATSNQMYDYIGAAHGNLAWLAWRSKDLIKANEQGRLALQAWQQLPNTYMFQWIALWPLIGTALKSGEFDQAIGFARKMLDGSQARMPSVLETALQCAVRAADGGDFDMGASHLEQILDRARELNFL